MMDLGEPSPEPVTAADRRTWRGLVRAAAADRAALVALLDPVASRAANGDHEAIEALIWAVDELHLDDAIGVSTTGVQHSRWVAPDGQSYEDEPTLFILPTSEGTTTVRLLGQTSTGEVVMAELGVTVRSRT